MASVGDEDDVQKSPKKISKLFGPIFNDSQRTKRIFGKSGNMNHPSEHSAANLSSGLEGLIDEKMIDILLFKSLSSVNKHNRSTSHSLKRREVAGLRCSRAEGFASCVGVSC